MSDDAAKFAEPPKEVTRYFEAKRLQPSWSWQDTGFDEHALAFSVAKTAGYNVLGDIRDAMATAIRKRQDFEDFRAALEPVLKAKGWWGKQHGIDPATGETVGVQLGSAARLKLIYNANIASAYAAGQWERIQLTKEVLPYLIYVISTAVKKREEHLQWVGTVLPVDDPWWDTHYPPNGWNCKCRIRQVSERVAEREGYDKTKPVRPAMEGHSETFVNKRTGEVTKIPRGISPGWAQNPGATRTQNAADMLAGKLDAAPPDARRIATADLADSWLFKRIQSGTIPYDRTSQEPGNVSRGRIAVPFAVLPDTVADAMGATSRMVRLSVADAAKQTARRVTRDGEPQVLAGDYLKVQALLDAGQIALKAGGDIVVQGEAGGKWWVAVIRRAKSAASEIYLKSLRRGAAKAADAVDAGGEIIQTGIQQD